MLTSSLGREDFAARLDTLATGVRLVQVRDALNSSPACES